MIAKHGKELIEFDIFHLLVESLRERRSDFSVGKIGRITFHHPQPI